MDRNWDKSSYTFCAIFMCFCTRIHGESFMLKNAVLTMNCIVFLDKAHWWYYKLHQSFQFDEMNVKKIGNIYPFRNYLLLFTLL